MCIRHNMDVVFIKAYTIFYQNSSICSEGIEEKHSQLHGHSKFSEGIT